MKIEEKIITTIKEIADKKFKNIFKLSASLIVNTNYQENAIIEFVNMIIDQYSEKESTNRQIVEKAIGIDNLNVILEYAKQKAVEQDFILMNKCLEGDC